MNLPHPSWFDWLTVAAIATGPILALLAQRGLDYLRERHNRRAKIYLTLMATRAAMLSLEHVQALNSIDVVFNRRRDQSIREAWRKVLDHLTVSPQPADWQQRLDDLRVDLLREIGLSVGYDFGTDYLKRQIYAPRYHLELEEDQLKIRKGLATVLTDEGLKVVVHEPPSPPTPPAQSPKFGPIAGIPPDTFRRP